MRKLRLLISVLAIAFLTSCSVEPEPISYGDDQCDFCKMGVVDKSHSAQYVTSKGKQFKFDAIECLIREIAAPEIDETDLAFVLVADYSKPGSMIDATSATFLISKAIKSPMGAYLSAFSVSQDAKDLALEKGGDTYTWEEIKSHFKK